MNRAEAGRLGAMKAMAFHEKARAQRLAAYAESPVACHQCGSQFPYEKRNLTFCDRSCAAAYNNRLYPKKTSKFTACSCGAVTRTHNKFCDGCISDGRHAHKATSVAQLSNDKGRRQYLLRTRKHECELCHRTEWEGKPIPLIMDHIDGQAEHNTETNLRLICPNCDALLPTYMGRNKGKGRRHRHDHGNGKTCRGCKPNKHAAVAQLVEHTFGKGEDGSSSLPGSFVRSGDETPRTESLQGMPR